MTECCGKLDFSETHVLVALMNGDRGHVQDLLAQFHGYELDILDDHAFALRVAIRRAREKRS